VYGQLPQAVREEIQIPDDGGGGFTASDRAGFEKRSAGSTYVRMDDMPEGAVQMCWDSFNKSLDPVYSSRKLGAVIFQFHLSFRPSAENLEYVLDCRSKLNARYNMAVEFRCRSWFTNPSWKCRMVHALREQGIALVAADELEHETFQKDKQQKGLPPGACRRILPIAMEATTTEFFYARVHRRHGMEDRRLDEGEIQAWCERLQHMASLVKGPLYFLWGTDHRNVPQKNRDALKKALPERLQLPWNPIEGSVLDMMMKSHPFSSDKKRERVEDDEPQGKESTSAACIPGNMKERREPNKATARGIERYFSKGAYTPR